MGGRSSFDLATDKGETGTRQSFGWRNFGTDRHSERTIDRQNHDDRILVEHNRIDCCDAGSVRIGNNVVKFAWQSPRLIRFDLVNLKAKLWDQTGPGENYRQSKPRPSDFGDFEKQPNRLLRVPVFRGQV